MPIRHIADCNPYRTNRVRPKYEPEVLKNKKLEEQKKDPAWNPDKYPHKQPREDLFDEEKTPGSGMFPNPDDPNDTAPTG